MGEEEVPDQDVEGGGVLGEDEGLAGFGGVGGGCGGVGGGDKAPLFTAGGASP